MFKWGRESIYKGNRNGWIDIKMGKEGEIRPPYKENGEGTWGEVLRGGDKSEREAKRG